MNLCFLNGAVLLSLCWGMAGCAVKKPAVAAPLPANSNPSVKPGSSLAEGSAIAHDFFLRARRLEMDGNDMVALNYYKIAFGYEPQSRDLCFILLDRLRESGKFDSAIALGKTCFKIAGTPTAVEHQMLGEAYLRADSVSSALWHYQRSSELDENDKEVLYTLVTLYEKLQNIPKYAEALERLVPMLDYPQRLVEKLLQVYRLLGRNAAGEPMLREAWRSTGRAAFGENLAAYYEVKGMNGPWLDVAEALYTGSRENGSYALMTARALAACGHPDSALSIYRERARVSPMEPDVLFPQAALLYDMGHTAEAFEIFKALAKNNPDHPVYQYFFGSTGMELKKPGFIEALEKAVALEPTVPEYWARLLYADYAAGHDSLAGTRLNRLENQEKSWQGTLFQGLIYALLARQLDPREVERAALFHDSALAHKQRLQAVNFFKRVLEENPENRRAHFELGANLERLGERPEAIRVLRSLIKIDTGNAVALNYLGYMLVEDNQELEFAGKILDKALNLDPENGAYMDSKGWWYYRMGNYNAARVILEKAASLMPKDPTILEHLATVLDRMGDAPAAHVAWDRLNRLDPKQAETRSKPVDQNR